MFPVIAIPLEDFHLDWEERERNLIVLELLTRWPVEDQRVPVPVPVPMGLLELLGPLELLAKVVEHLENGLAIMGLRFLARTVVEEEEGIPTNLDMQIRTYGTQAGLSPFRTEEDLRWMPPGACMDHTIRD